MDNLKLAQLAERLLRAGVAPRHVRRSLEELRAHRADLLAQFAADGLGEAESERIVDERMGSIDSFYAATVARPELMSWPRRRPALVFGLLPVLAFIALAVGSVALLVGLTELAEPLKVDGALPQGVRATGMMMRLWVLWAVPIAVAAACALLAVRWRLRPWWPAIGVALVAVVGSTTTMQLSWAAQNTPGSIQAGIGFPGEFVRVLPVLAGVLLPYLLWVYRRGRAGAADLRADE